MKPNEHAESHSIITINVFSYSVIHNTSMSTTTASRVSFTYHNLHLLQAFKILFSYQIVLVRMLLADRMICATRVTPV